MLKLLKRKTAKLCPSVVNNVTSENFTSYAYILGWRGVTLLPEPVAERLFNFIADRASHNGRGPEQLRKNLARVVGPENVTRDLVKRSMRSYMRYWREAFQLPAMDVPHATRAFYQGLDLQSKAAFDQSLSRGRGVILTLPHSANWDIAGLWLATIYGQFTTVAERLKPESLYDAFVDYRESLNFEVLPLTGGDIRPYDRLREVLSEGGIICLLGDRDLSSRGVPVDFFGEKTSMPVGPALLAKETGADLYVISLWFNSDKKSPAWETRFSPPVDTSQPLEAIVQAQADLYAESIASHPADWHMLQPLWWSDLTEEQRRRRGLQEEE